MTPFERLVFKELFTHQDDTAEMQRYVKQSFAQMANTIQQEREKLLLHQQNTYPLASRLAELHQRSNERETQAEQIYQPRANSNWWEQQRPAQTDSNWWEQQSKSQQQRPAQTDSNRWEQQRPAQTDSNRWEQQRPAQTDSNWWEQQEQSKHQRKPQRPVQTYSNWWERDEFTETPPIEPQHHSQQPRYLAETASSRSRRIARERDTERRLQQNDPPLAHEAIFPAPLAFTSRMGL